MSQRGEGLGRALVSHRKHQGPVLVFSFLSTHIRVRSWWLPHNLIDQILRKQFEDFCEAFAFSSYCKCFSFRHLGQGPRCPNWDNLLCGHVVCASDIVACHEDFFILILLGAAGEFEVWFLLRVKSREIFQWLPGTVTCEIECKMGNHLKDKISCWRKMKKRLLFPIFSYQCTLWVPWMSGSMLSALSAKALWKHP